MGHSGYLSEYRNYSDKRLAEEYLQHQQNLMVYEVSPDLSGINNELKTLREEKEKMKAELMEMRLQILEMKNK